ncbi:MAG: nucleotidyltransferase domain-containing protein [Anaerolineales bacterium]|nr:nucleotidyltransferase domain-containing protein [Anaerolineales bacterium]
MTLVAPTVDVRSRIPNSIIQELVARIADTFKPQQIILFGSYASNTPRPESDVDLLVVMETPLREAQQALEIRQHVNPLFGVDILVYKPSRMKERLGLGDSFLREITSKGIVMYESPDA